MSSPAMKKLADLTEPELRKLCNLMGKEIEWAAARCGVEKPMFALLLFNDPKIAQYVCNCRREDVIEAMRECADRLEKKQDVER
jgi:hypothetical protein